MKLETRKKTTIEEAVESEGLWDLAFGEVGKACDSGTPESCRSKKNPYRGEEKERQAAVMIVTE